MNKDDTSTARLPDSSDKESADKYIRTFANDMEIFQKGGIPDLSPFQSSGTIQPESLPPPLPIEIAPTEMEVPKPEVSPPKPLVPEVVKEIPELPETESMKVVDISHKNRMSQGFSSPAPLKTYSEDFRERMKETHASTMTILAAEQDSAPRTYQEIPEKPKQNNGNRWYIVSGIVLLCVGGVGVYFAYSHYLNSFIPVVVSGTSATPIFVDARENVSGTGTDLMQEIKKSINTPLASNTIQLLSLTSVPPGVGILDALQISAPGTLLRNVDATGSMVGIVNTSTGQSAFFILGVSSYSSTFSGMLSWEPVMQRSLGTLFPIYPTSATVVATTTIATTTASAVSPPKEGFRDDVVNNHDARVYRDAQGRSILLYGYWNQTTLIIARDPAAFSEILGRLATSHTQS